MRRLPRARNRRPRRAAKALLAGVDAKARLAEHYLAQGGGWDLFATVFAESHCAGHQFWAAHDTSNPRHEAQGARELGDPLRDVYVSIDAAIGRLLAQTSEDTTVFVLASHGMGPHYDATYLLDEILRRLYSRAAAPARAATQAAESVWRWIPAGLRRRLGALRKRVRSTLVDAATHQEQARLPCFATPNNDVCGGIRINLAGREPEGKIQPGAEYDAFCRTLADDLHGFVNVGTGRPLVRRVLRTSDLFRGERLQEPAGPDRGMGPRRADHRDLLAEDGHDPRNLRRHPHRRPQAGRDAVRPRSGHPARAIAGTGGRGAVRADHRLPSGSSASRGGCRGDPGAGPSGSSPVSRPVFRNARAPRGMLTVLIATHNGARTLPVVLEAYVRLQPPAGGWKLVVVDNASEDGTGGVLRSFAGRLPLRDLHVDRQGQNIARNRGLEEAEGDLLVFGDDDAIPREDWLVRMRAAADARPGFGIFAGAIRPRWEVPPEPWLLESVPLAPCLPSRIPPGKRGP